MTESQETSAAENFSRELRSFFVLCLLSLVFGSLAMAFGMQFIVTAVLAMAGSGTFYILPFFQALIGWAAAVVGFRWILSSARILKGVNRIRREYRALEEPAIGEEGRAPEKPLSGETKMKPVPAEPRAGPVSGDALTGLIVRMMAHYRENWKTIWRMNLISTLGGCIFLVLGLLNLIQGISAAASGSVPVYILLVREGLTSGMGRTVLLSFLAAGINLAIGLVSLISSSWFRKYARAWERRLIEAEHSEEDLRRSMGQG